MTAADVADLLAPSRRVAQRVVSYGYGSVLEPLDDPEPITAVPQPPGWRTACLGPYILGERCLHRVAAGRLPLAEVCEGCTRLVMDELTGALPDLPWAPAWWRRAGCPEGGPS